MKGSHGIRWAAAQAHTIKAVVVDLPAIVVDLELTAKAECGFSLTSLSPSEVFVNKTFKQSFEGHSHPFKATVKAVIPSS